LTAITSAVRHPIFARVYACLSRQEPPDLREHRRELVAGLAGRVLELGAGAGANFPHYPSSVTELVAVEPEPYLRARARERAAAAPLRITVVDGTADALPAGAGALDAAVVSLVLCSVHDQPRALAELRRVLRPGAELRFFEHVLSGRPGVAWTQRLLDRTLWPRLFGGCHTARDTPRAIAAAGFDIERVQARPVGPRAALPVRTHVIGTARRP
jgi:SAM-dependent methyltransferase